MVFQKDHAGGKIVVEVHATLDDGVFIEKLQIALHAGIDAHSAVVFSDEVKFGELGRCRQRTEER